MRATIKLVAWFRITLGTNNVIGKTFWNFSCNFQVFTYPGKSFGRGKVLSVAIKRAFSILLTPVKYGPIALQAFGNEKFRLTGSNRSR